MAGIGISKELSRSSEDFKDRDDPWDTISSFSGCLLPWIGVMSSIECLFFFLSEELVKFKVSLLAGFKIFMLSFFNPSISLLISFDFSTRKIIEKVQSLLKKSRCDVLKYIFRNL